MRIKTKLLELPSPARVWITQTLGVDAARQTTFDSCFHKWGRQKRKQTDLAHCASSCFANCSASADRFTADEANLTEFLNAKRGRR